MSKLRVAVVGAGQFGSNHMRVVAQSERADLAAVVDRSPERAAEAGGPLPMPGAGAAGTCSVRLTPPSSRCPPARTPRWVARCLRPASTSWSKSRLRRTWPRARRLVETAQAHGRVLQIGHLERYNPAVTALKKLASLPLFFEVHRMSVFTPRSLDVDVVLDLMIHDLDIVLDLVREQPEEIRAAGITILSHKVDIANVRLAFPGGCVANLTASRVSTERVRKLRLFQPNQYISLDYARQDAVIFETGKRRGAELQGGCRWRKPSRCDWKTRTLSRP